MTNKEAAAAWDVIRKSVRMDLTVARACAAFYGKRSEFWDSPRGQEALQILADEETDRRFDRSPGQSPLVGPKARS